MNPSPPAGLSPRRLLQPLVLFVVPLFALWFGHHVEADMDGQVLANVQQALTQDESMEAEERAAMEAFFRSTPVSTICAASDPDSVAMRSSFGDLCDDYAQFRWMQQLSFAAILLGLIGGAVSVAAAVAAFYRRSLQIPAFAVTWNALRVIGALEVIVQGVLIVGLSYWVTVYWFNTYVPKLILVAGLMALVAAGTVIMAIFAKITLENEVEGGLITESDAPELWRRVRELAARIGTEPPTRIIGGIDDNFFVTEGTLVLDGRRHDGRTLFVSLALLRGLDAAEAEAVLSHELAHFSGGDTAHSRTLMPMRARYARYLDALHQNPVSLPVFYMMVAFWEMFGLALAKTSRERELRADRVAAEQTSSDAVAKALLKVAAWARYRGEVEHELFSQEQVLTTVGIPDRVRSGFEDFARSSRLIELKASETPHPMDSHPPNTERFESIGVLLPESKWAEVLLAPVTDSWYDRIPVAQALEAQLWAAYEARFAANQRFKIAVELTPRTPEEVALVVAHFPPVRFVDTSGATRVELTWESISHDGWTLRWEEISAAALDDHLLGKRLVLTTMLGKKLIPSRGMADNEGFLAAFGNYWGRSQIAAKKRGG